MYNYYIPSLWLKERQAWDRAINAEAHERNVRKLTRMLLVNKLTWEELENALDKR
jgi:hypothetical protein